jgi:hypothetical protein
MLLAAMLVATPAFAQETTHSSGAVDGLIDPTLTRSWSEGEERIFASATVDAGYLYLRPRGALGWGKPFRDWVGIEANPIASSAGLGAYGGLRFALSFMDLRVGPRYFSAFQHCFLDPRPSYDRLDFDHTDNPKSRILTWEAELNIGVPLGPGELIGLASASIVTGVPENKYVFEETLHVIVVPPYVWRGRIGYVFRFGPRGQYSLGPVFDVLHVPRRDDSRTLRAGPVMRIQLSRHFDVRGSFVTTIASPDRLGLVGGDFTELGVRYRWATE